MAGKLLIFISYFIIIVNYGFGFSEPSETEDAEGVGGFR